MENKDTGLVDSQIWHSGPAALHPLAGMYGLRAVLQAWPRDLPGQQVITHPPSVAANPSLSQPYLAPLGASCWSCGRDIAVLKQPGMDDCSIWGPQHSHLVAGSILVEDAMLIPGLAALASTTFLLCQQ